MEELLNKLIEKGWKPSGKECSHFIKQHSPDVLDWKVIYTAVRKDEGVYNIHYTLRELVSKESGLWQFVCENGMIKEQCKHERILDPTFGEGWADCKRQEHDGKYGYRVMGSALKDESELEQFLLNNITVGN